jgi:hypothetical protein
MTTLNLSLTTPEGVGGFLIRSSDSWATGIASNYAPSSRTAEGFLSFCLEKNEHFYFDRVYQFGISSAAVHGGEATSDPVSVGTGYLYSLFAQGNLVGTPELIQRTIWYLEDERPDNPGIYDVLLSQKFGSVAAAKADFVAGESSATYGVQVINLGESPYYAGQDQLVYGAPETASWMAGTVLVALVAITKWRNR